jgi:hypothetical protein
MAPVSVAVIDALDSLLEAEANSIFHFVGAGSPLLAKAGAEVRQPLAEMSRHLDEHQKELMQLIRRLGKSPASPPAPKADDQYLSYLSLKFLLPKLVDAKQLMIQRYHNALETIAGNPQILEILERHIAEMELDLQVLKKTAADVSRIT